MREGGNSRGASNRSGPNVFTPVQVKGLPPKSPAGVLESSSSSKCRSLERDQKSKSSNNESASSSSSSNKFTPPFDAARCKSLDRRELKAQAKEEKTQKKSSVSSKAAFFGGLLSRRSPSPGRKKDSSSDSSSKNSSPAPKGRFTFSRNNNNNQPQNVQKEAEPVSRSDQDIDTEFLDMQGRSSQRSRISKWTTSTSNLESLQEHPGSPWVQRRSGGDISSPRKASVESIVSNNEEVARNGARL
jgi:hypothetical protein